MPAHGKFTAEVCGKIVAVLRAGNYSTVAARFAGISPGTLRRWLRRGQIEVEGPFRDFHDQVVEALAFAETRAVANIVKEFKDDWRAALTYLERKYPHRWGRRDSEDERQRRAERRRRRSPAKSNDELPDLDRLARILKTLAETGALTLPSDKTSKTVSSARSGDAEST